MQFPVRKYSRNQVDKAGKFICGWRSRKNKKTKDLENFIKSFRILNNWRSSHSYPLNTFNATLRKKAKRLKMKDVIIAQRLKRTPSIVKKLGRFSSMNLSRMQDIGGLRIVVNTNKQVDKLKEDYKNSKFKHELSGERDYILCPQDSGYRSVHLVYKYRGSRTKDYDGLCVELQIRTKIQHAWATAVETMGVYLNQSLKSSEGSDRWLDFFALVSSGFSYLEETHAVPGYDHMSRSETFEEIAKQANKLNVLGKLSGYNVAADHIERTSKSAFHLIVLYPEEQRLIIKPFGRHEVDIANQEYTNLEKKMAKGANIDAVLVASGTISELKKAYPNYFLDTHLFIKHLQRIIKEAEAK